MAKSSNKPDTTKPSNPEPEVTGGGAIIEPSTEAPIAPDAAGDGGTPIAPEAPIAPEVPTSAPETPLPQTVVTEEEQKPLEAAVTQEEESVSVIARVKFNSNIGGNEYSMEKDEKGTLPASVAAILSHANKVYRAS